MNWINRYQDAMRRTRLLGITGASLVVVSVAVEMFRVAHTISLEEARYEVLAANFDAFLFAFAFAAIFTVRISVLLWRNDTAGYYEHVASWISAMAIAIGYWWWSSPMSQTSQVCSGNGVCFGIYDIRRTDWLEVSTFFYVWGSLLRSAVTALYAALKFKYA